MRGTDQAVNPFPGLRPFESCETHLFFGRDGQSDELLRRLKRTRFLAVVGTSGSGKSSLVRAGLLPGLQGGLMASAGSDWRIAILRPGGDPIGNLARALTSPAVLGWGNENDADMQAVLAETTLRRSSLGLVELVSRACTKPDERGQPIFHDYENLLVVVDQFEELFRFKQLIEEENSKEDAAAFVKLLLEAAGHKHEKRIYVVLTMRSDFLGDCSQFWGLPEAINNGQYLIPRMTRDQRRSAISGPVAVGQGAISEPLVNQLLNDVGDNPDQLPILQHALMRTWDYWLSHRSNGNPLDIPDYHAIGGMAEALSRHADEAFAELDERQQAIAEKLFKGLTEKGTDNREIRNPMEVQEICELTETDESAVTAVIDVFRREGRSFLVPPPNDALTGTPVELNRESLIDISHESLIRNWERLKTWVDEEAQSARIYRRLAETAMLHHEGEEALLMDPALQGALDWREKNEPNVVWAQRYHPEFATATRYLDASVAARDAETKERECRRIRETRYQRSKWVLIVLGLAFTLSLAALTFANSKLTQAKSALAEAKTARDQALEQRLQATAQANAAEEQAARAKSESAIAEEEQKVALKDKQGAEQAKANAVKQASLAVLAKHEADKRTEAAREAQAQSLHLLYSADINLAQQAYQSSNTKRVRELLDEAAPGEARGFEWYYVRHLLDSERSSRKAPGKGLLLSVASPDGKTIVVGAGGTVKLREIGAHVERTIVLPEGFTVGSLAISPDGRKLAVGSSSSRGGETVRLYDPKSLVPIGSLRESADSANVVVFSPNSKRLIVGGGDGGSVSLWDLDSPQQSEVLPANGTVFLDLSRDGKMLAAGSMNPKANTFPVLLWEMSAKEKVARELLGHGGKITSVSFSPDGGTLATGSLDRTVRLWDTKSGHSLRVLAFVSRVFSLAFSPKGHFLAIGFEDGSIKLYDARENLDGPTLIGHHQAVTSLSFSSSRLLFSSDNKVLSSPDDENLFFQESSETGVKEWDVAMLTREQTAFRFRKADETKGDLARRALTGDLVRRAATGHLVYSADGSMLVASADTDTTLINAETNKPIETSKEQDVEIVPLAFSRDGKLMATAESDSAGQKVIVRIRDASNKKPIGKAIREENGVSYVAFSPNSKFLATFTSGGAVKVWDTASSKLVSDLDGEGSGVLEFAFLADNRLLAFYEVGVGKLWNINPEKLLSEFQLPRKNTDADTGPAGFAVSPDSRYFAASYNDGTAVLYNMTTGKPLATLKCQAENAPTIAFSPNGKLLATGGFDGTLKLWDTTSRRELLTLRGTPYQILSIAFSPDETKLAILDAFRYLRVWRAPTDAGIAVETKPTVTSSSWRTSADPLSRILNAGAKDGMLSRFDFRYLNQ